VILVQAVSRDDEMPSIGVMLEQFQGAGITSVGTHVDGVALTAIESKLGWTTWQTTLTFVQLPLNSGDYTLSVYLFDAPGLVVYEEWKDYIQFQWLSSGSTPGMVRLPHRWD
jgi:lipopolysaccharide transport system ATP-binding protein